MQGCCFILHVLLNVKMIAVGKLLGINCSMELLFGLVVSICTVVLFCFYVISHQITSSWPG